MSVWKLTTLGKKISTVAGAGFQMVAPRGMEALQWPVKMLIGRMLNAGDAGFELLVALAWLPSISIETLVRPMANATNARNITPKSYSTFLSFQGPIRTDSQFNKCSQLAEPLLPVKPKIQTTTIITFIYQFLTKFEKKFYFLLLSYIILGWKLSHVVFRNAN